MPKQSDIDFANEVLRQKLVPREVVDECLGLLANLQEVGMEDSLDGIMCLKGHLTQEQASTVWKKAFEGEFDEDREVFLTLDSLEAAAASSPSPETEPQAPAPAAQDAPAGESPAAGESPPAEEKPPEPVKKPRAPSPLPKVPGFSVEAKLERDSTGINYLASRDDSARKSVIHILYPQMGTDQEFMNWLVKHGRKLSRVEHPQSARFHAIQPFENRAYFAQEIPAGEPLSSLLETEEIEEEKALLVIEQVAEIILTAQEKGLVHGRLTPDNIFVGEDYQVEVRFFTFPERERELFVGTPPAEDLPYLPPEVRQKKGVSRNSDVFSLGRIFLRMTGGDKKAPNAMTVKARRIAGKMIAVNPSERYADPKALLSDLERYFQGKDISEDLPGKEGPKAEAPAEEPPVKKAKAVAPTASPPAKKKSSGRPPASRRGTRVLRAKPVEPEEAEEEDSEEEEASRARPRARKGSRRGPPSGRKSPGRARMKGKSSGRKTAKALPVEEEAVPPRKPSDRRTKKVARALPVEEVEEAPAEDSEEEDSRVVKGLDLADRRESRGDLGGAVEALQDVLEFAIRPEPLEDRIADLRGRALSDVRERAKTKEEAGDFRGAIKIWESGRVFAKDESEIDAVIRRLEERQESERRRQQVEKLEKKIESHLAKSDVLAAISALEEAKEVSESPGAVEARIYEIRREAYEKRMEESRSLESEGDYDGAIKAAQRAREFAEHPDEVTAIVEALERRREKHDQQKEYHRCEEEARKRAEEGDIDGAVEWYERAKKYATSAVAVDAKIEGLRHATYESHLSEARQLEESGRFQDAIFAWEKARPHAPDPEEVEAAIEVLRGRIAADEKEKAFQRLKAEADALEKEGRMEEAIQKMQEASSLGGASTYSTRLKIDTLRKTAFDHGVALSEKLKKEGNLDGAIEAVENVRRYTSDKRAVDLMIATLKREKSVAKKEREFKRLEAAARAKAKEGDIQASLKLLEKAKAYAESPVAVQVKIDGLRKVTFDRLMDEAKKLEGAGDWTEALEKYSAAREFADQPQRVDEIVEALRREMDRVKKESELNRILASADTLVQEGKIREAVARLEQAKPLVGDPTEIQKRIDNLLIESMFRKCVELSEKKEASGDLPGAVEACIKAKEYASDPSVVERRLQRLYAQMKGEEAPAEEPEKTPEETAPPPEAPAPQPKAPAADGEPLPGIKPVDADSKPEPEPESKAPAPGKKATTRRHARPSGPIAVGPDATGDLIVVVCPNPDCEREFRVKAKYEGRKGKCPACKTAVDVPVRGEKVVCFLCDKVMPKSKAKKRGDEYYCMECEDFIGGS